MYPRVASSFETARFRALHREEGGQEFLYLSWHVKKAFNVATAGANTLWVGFRDDSTSGKDIAINIKLHPRTNVDVFDDGLVAVDDPYDVQLWTKAVTDAGTDWTMVTTPSWLANASSETRIWIKHETADGDGNWAINMRIPVSDQVTVAGLPRGIDIDNDFNMWYQVELGSPFLDEVYFPRWPRDVAISTADVPSPTENWGNVKLSTATPDPTCATNVFFPASDIGVVSIATSSQQIHFDLFNVLFARPKNSSTSPANNARKKRVSILYNNNI